MRYEGTETLLIKSNRGSDRAKAELKSREHEYIKTGLKALRNADIVYVLTDEIKESLRYINNNISKVVKNSKIVEESILIDSFHSATIEGANTTVEKVLKAFSASTINRSKDDRMVINSIKGLNYAYKNKITDDNIRNLWEIVVYGVCENVDCIGTKYRSGMVYIGSSTQIIHIPAPAHEIQNRMTAMFEYIKEKCDEVLATCIAHFYFAYIHPFCDGNGRTARILHNKQLSEINEELKAVSVADAINSELHGYYKSMQESEFEYNGKMDITPFLEYMLDRIAVAVNNSLNKYYKLSERQLKIMKIAEKGKELTVKRLALVIGCSETTCRKELNELVKIGKLRKRIENSKYFYSILN